MVKCGVLFEVRIEFLNIYINFVVQGNYTYNHILNVAK
jgi:hypothetical protein